MADNHPPDAANPAYPDQIDGEDYWAKDNLDLQRVGDVLQRSESPEQFERYLNEPDGINNLDLNGDGYADYISVEEYEDRDSNSRGLSLFSRFGPDLIQEIATVLLYRDQPNYPGARFLINGNDQLYGDNYYYETDWLNQQVPIATYLYNDRDQYYRSPYYYDNYPTWYQPYDIVDTPVYRTRIERVYPQPAFVYTTAPVVIQKVKIKSPNFNKHFDQVHAKLVKPTKEQADFVKGHPEHVKLAKGGRRHDVNGDKPGRDNPPRSDRGDERGNPGKDERGAQRGNPNHPDGGKPDKVDHGGGNPNKVDHGGGNPNKGGGAPPKMDNPNKGGGGNPNKGGGNPNKGGGGNPNKGGGGGKGGKKP
ncbi:MAG: hypothetical protein DMF63_02015 [Acidobacteria bacterium]|nr:MAG: hypothetical protein DMF63_02015 [Acidobacteriota bacterium]